MTVLDKVRRYSYPDNVYAEEIVARSRELAARHESDPVKVYFALEDALAVERGVRTLPFTALLLYAPLIAAVCTFSYMMLGGTAFSLLAIFMVTYSVQFLVHVSFLAPRIATHREEVQQDIRALELLRSSLPPVPYEDIEAARKAR